MRYVLTDKNGKQLGTLELTSTPAEFWRAMQRLRVQLHPAPVAPVITTTAKAKAKRSADDVA